MRIAVPTDDALSIAPHFGKSAAFLLFDTAEGEILRCETTLNHGCHGHHDDSHGAHSADAHATMLAGLAGSDVVICAGIGQGAIHGLKQAGVRHIVVTDPGPAESAVRAYLRGELKQATRAFCQCSH